MDNNEAPKQQAQSDKSKTKRKSLSKVRTGCKTCKTRRVKCDEARPACLRCIKWGGPSNCEGYDRINESTLVLTAKHHRLLPNPAQLCRTPTTQKFSSNEEYSFFQRFCIESTVQLTGSRHSELWNRVVLQASEMEPCVRHAVIAIGALDFQKLSHEGNDYTSIHREFTFMEYGALTAVGMMNSGSWQKKLSGGQGKRRGRKIAYEEYGKAIASLRKAVAEKRSEVATRLIACLLFVLFECFHGNNDSAAAQTHAGIRMMEEHSRQRSEWTSNLKTISPPPIDEEIVETFALLEIQAAGWSANVEPDMYLARVHDGKAVEEIPHEFRSLKHAAFILSTLVLRGAQVRSGRIRRAKFAPGSTDDGFATGEPVYNVGPEHAEFCNVLNKLQLWNVAFTPLLRRAGRVSGKHLKKEAITLKMHYLSSYLWAASGAPLPEMYYERHTKELVEIVSLAKVLIDDASIKRETSLDLRLVLPLMIASFYYRHRTIRQDVISIFNTLPRREGMWDASMLGKLLEWIVELEEGNLTDEGYVPMDRIVNVTKLEIDAPNRTVVAEAIQSVRGEEDSVVTRSKILSW